MEKKVAFHRLTVEGFRSYQQNTIFPLDSTGINLVKGGNGAGKTTIFSALCWVLFKVNLNGTVNDKIQTWEWLRDETYRGTRVTVDFSTGKYDYRVARHMKFKGKTSSLKAGDSLMIFRKDKSEEKFSQDHLVGEAHHKGDQQEYINTVLGMDSRTFLNSVLFGQRMSRLVSADNEEKRKLFEQLFAVDFIDTAKEKAKEKKIRLEGQISTLQEGVRSGKQGAAQLEDRIKEQSTILTNFKAGKAQKVEAVELRIVNGKKCLKTAKTELADLEAKQPKAGVMQSAVKYNEYDAAMKVWKNDKKELEELQRKSSQTTEEINKSKNTEEKLKRQLQDVKDKCPTCGAAIKKEKVDDVKKELQKQIDKEKEVQEVLAKSGKALLAEVKEKQRYVDLGEESVDKAHKVYEQELNNEKHTIKIQQDYALKKQEVKNYETALTSLEAELKRTEDEEPPKIDLAATKQKRAKMLEDVEESEKKLEETKVTLDKVLWWYNKAFGAGGLKAFVFSAMLGQLNRSVRKYASRLGFGVKFSIDLTKANKPFVTKCFKGENEIDYQELSGGQKQRIDVCLAFAMHDVVCGISSLSLLIMDEIFEGLDAEGIETVFDLIRIKAGEGRSIFVVTHSKVIDSLTAKTINIEMDEKERSYIQ